MQYARLGRVCALVIVFSMTLVGAAFAPPSQGPSPVQSMP